MKKIENIIRERIYTSSFWLIISSITVSLFGFIFWAINARLFTVEEIGLASTLIAASNLIIMASFLGMDFSLIKFAGNKNKKDIISLCFTIPGLVAFIISLVFVIGIRVFSPSLALLRNTFFGITFIVFVVFYLFYFLMDDLFIALKKSRIVFIKSLAFSILKLGFPFALISFGAYGIFAAWIFPAMITFFLGLFFLKYKPFFKIHIPTIKKIFNFSLINYVSNFFRNAPGMIFPIMITNLISPVKTAYFYISWMIASFLFIIPLSISKTLLSEGSEKNSLHKNIRKSFFFTFTLLIPSALLVFFASKYILLLFGPEYSENGFRILQILSISSFPFAINMIYFTVRNIQSRLRTILFLSVFIAFTSIGFGYFLLGYGIVMMAVSWLAAQSLVSIYSIIKLFALSNEKNG